MKTFQPEPHTPKPLKRIPWRVCSGCGLVYLHNALTDWCIKHGCNHEEHPGFKAALRTLGRVTAEDSADRGVWLVKEAMGR